MNKKHPIIAVTGASGAGTTSVQQAFKEIFHRQGLNAAFVQGDGFFKFDNFEMCQQMNEAERLGKSLSCYGPDLNLFDKLEQLF